jgi:signal transduction histidine kinase
LTLMEDHKALGRMISPGSERSPVKRTYSVAVAEAEEVLVSPSAASEGAAHRLLLRLGRQYAAVGRCAVGLLSVLLGVAAAGDAERSTMLIVGGLAVGWSAVYAAWVVRGPTAWLVVIDVSVVVLACLTQHWTVPVGEIVDGGSGWVIVFASFSAVVLQLHTTLAKGTVAVLVIDTALLTGLALSPVGWSAGSAGKALWVLVEAALARLLWWLVRRAGATADLSIAGAERARGEATVAAAQREEQRAYAATLHDTAATTLLMVGLGEVGRSDTWLPLQASRDLGALTSSPVHSDDLVVLLTELADAHPVRVRLSLPEPIPVDPPVAEAVCGAVREALNNVARHAGVTEASVRSQTTGKRVLLEVIDEGCGFDQSAVVGTRYGIARSITARMGVVGGCAAVLSAPGLGTTVRLEWTRC